MECNVGTAERVIKLQISLWKDRKLSNLWQNGLMAIEGIVNIRNFERSLLNEKGKIWTVGQNVQILRKIKQQKLTLVEIVNLTGSVTIKEIESVLKNLMKCHVRILLQANFYTQGVNNFNLISAISDDWERGAPTNSRNWYICSMELNTLA